MAWAAKSGTKTVADTGTPEALGSGAVNGGALYIRGLASNTKAVQIGDSASMTGGLELAPTDPPTILYVTDLGEVFVKVGADGEGVSWGLQNWQKQ
jgi:hypothetical protein